MNPSGEELLDNLENIFRKYTIQQTRHEYTALALYVVFTHAIEHFDFATRLLITSAEKRSGKTRTMTILSNLVKDPLIAANATVAAINRSLGADNSRTLCFDEADTIFGTKMKAEQNEELRGILNSGFQRGTPALRVNGLTNQVDEFDTFAPAVLCAIGTLPDTVVDRAVNIRLRRRKNGETVADYRIRRDQPALHDVREAVSQWVEERQIEFCNFDYDLLDNPLYDRAADAWEPLLTVGSLAGKRWAHKAKEAALYFAKASAENDVETSPGMELLADIRSVLTLVRADKVQSSNLISLLTALEESRWSEEGLSAKRLNSLLKPYGIHSVRLPSGSARGYRVSSFQDVFERYLPPTPDLSDNPTENLDIPG